MVRTIIEDSRPEKILLGNLNAGFGFIFDDSFYIKTDSVDESCSCRLLCINVQTWEIARICDEEWIIPCRMEMKVMAGKNP